MLRPGICVCLISAVSGVRRLRPLVPSIYLIAHKLATGSSSEPLLGHQKIVLVGSCCRIDPKGLCFLVYSRVAIFRTRVIAEKARTAPASLRLDCLEHVGQSARIVTCLRHDARAQQVRFGLVFAAEL